MRPDELKPLPVNPIQISDTTFRDAHQSLLATRLRTEDMVPIAALMDSIGFYSMEVWGGATFDATTRFLGEDPWERLRTFRQLMPNTRLSMLLRGQALVGYRPYADDIVDAFVERSAENGIDIFRVFDSLNDEYNLERAAAAVKNSGKHLQMTICYSVTDEGRMGGPIYNIDYYMEKARRFADFGADSLCIKDMAGLLAPYDARDLVQSLKGVLDVPVQLHTHYTSGMAAMSVLMAIDAGIDIVDTCLAPLALRTSQPAIEPLIASLAGRPRDPGLDLDKIAEAGAHLEKVLPRYADHLRNTRAAVIDTNVLSHQIPGGMASNLSSQLREANALDRLDEVLAEIPETRKDLGYPPLVTPMSQMIGTQSVSNVVMGRYKLVSDQVKDYVRGMYGRPPSPVDPETAEIVLKDGGKDRIEGRPADHLDPELQAARDTVAELSTDIDDALIYALYPTTGMRFLKIKHGIEPMPEDMKPPAPVEEKDGAETGARTASEQPEKSPAARRFNVFVGERMYEVEVDPVGGSVPVITAAGAAPRPVSAPAPVSDGRQPERERAAPRRRPPPPRRAAAPRAASAASQSASGGDDAQLIAPMPGIVLRHIAKIGQQVNEGDPVLILEAMKMENALPSPASGVLKDFTTQVGENVATNDVLAVISAG